ncbi:diguanylate cyclase domain-containing protein [Nitrincola sp. MINF-07-Sa-05]|uniref:diguanylate cyclase domain-containing protein n=1 Tax=Nitrincola salilacus TaxID=3400273 RepID=UPI003917E171
MSSDGKDDASGSGVEKKTDDARDYSVRVRSIGRRRRDRTACADNETLVGRRQIAEAREQAANQRENVAGQREGVVLEREVRAAARENEIRSTEALQSTMADQMIRLQQANANLVVASIEAQKLAEQIQIAKIKLDHLAHHDTLTGLPNRILLYDRLAQAISASQRSGNLFAVLFMDLDGFKHINDSLGHSVGDQLLQSVGKRLLGCVRQSDTISRHGGDEFVALLIDIDHPQVVALSVQKMLEAIALPHHLERHDLSISVSIGISIFPGDGMNAETLIKNSDTAMYHAKGKGRKTYAFFDQEMTARILV